MCGWTKKQSDRSTGKEIERERKKDRERQIEREEATTRGRDTQQQKQKDRVPEGESDIVRLISNALCISLGF